MKPRMLVLLVLWVVTLCNALSSGGPLLQSLPCSTYCSVTAVVHTTIIFIDVTASAATVPIHLTSDVYLVISSYGVVSTTSTKGACNRAENTRETLPTPFSISSEPAFNMNYTVASYFIDYLTHQGQSVASCAFSNVESTDSSHSITFFKSYPSVSSTASSSLFQANESSTLSSTVSSSLFQPNASFSSTAREASSGLEIKNKIILGVLLPISLIALIILGVLGVRNRRPAAAIANGEDPTISHKDTQPYIQRKPELEDEARRIHELMAQGRFYEIEGQEAAQEMGISS